MQALTLVPPDDIGSGAKIISSIFSLNFLNHFHHKLTHLFREPFYLERQAVARNNNSFVFVLEHFAILKIAVYKNHIGIMIMNNTL